MRHWGDFLILKLRGLYLFDEKSRNLISFPGGHVEGFPDKSKQMFKEV